MTVPSFGRRDPDGRGYFGEYGGRFVPETLVAPVEELERAYFEARADPAFTADLEALLRRYVGRPTPVYEAQRLRAALESGAGPGGVARICLTRDPMRMNQAASATSPSGSGRCRRCGAASTDGSG